ncbi:hypothetical protein GCK32_011792 [Trichostrongylus colubriformis]|uniref:Uncharacterized protein n=1 Tax=Trichostrongylus colubriformis TaxID=6319 RepID=A0AAN8FIS3_TRICO
MLSQSTLPKRNPSSTGYEQCSILRRLSSTCPVDGIIFCDAAPDTNVYCRNGVWTARVSNTGTDVFVPISSVSCAQRGSVGADKGYITGSAVSKK